MSLVALEQDFGISGKAARFTLRSKAALEMDSVWRLDPKADGISEIPGW